MNKNVLKLFVFAISLVVAGYYGASFAQSIKDMEVCRAEMAECHRDFSIWGFEVVGK